MGVYSNLHPVQKTFIRNFEKAENYLYAHGVSDNLDRDSNYSNLLTSFSNPKLAENLKSSKEFSLLPNKEFATPW